MKIIGIDTEFIRRKTYLPILSLVQINYGNEIILYDVLNETPEERGQLIATLKDDSIVKVFHSCRQDIEAFYFHFNITPKNIFDTQIAAEIFYKDKNQICYGKLVDNLFSIKLTEDEQTSNWLLRPLTKEQISYAKQDVFYLIKIYDFFAKNMEKEDFDKSFRISNHLSDESLYKFDPEGFYKKKGYNKLRINEKQHKALKEIMIWREKTAFEENIPRQFIIKNHDLVNIIMENQSIQSTKMKYRYKNEIGKIINSFLST